MGLFGRLMNDTGGATALEYGLIAAMIAVVSMVAFTAVGVEVGAVLNTVSNHL